MSTLSVDQTSQWQALVNHAQQLKKMSLCHLFSQDLQRASHYHCSALNIFFDYSKNLITQETLNLLMDLANTQQLPQAINSLFSGKTVNFTEGRPAKHMALRSSNPDEIITESLEKISKFVKLIHQGQWLGYSGKKITDIINIGIGGSDLGPRLVTQALAPYHVAGITSHFVSNIDATDIKTVLQKINPETSLFIIASKTFTTLETLTNAETARDWLLSSCKDSSAVAKHFVAVTAKPERAVQFGIDAKNTFAFWDWVGGRYSLWSAIGLPIALSVGMDHFKALLAGAEAMDIHFKTSPLANNLPVILAMLGIWYRNFCHYPAYAVIPYDERLKLLPAYLQQLDMESNGKQVNIFGETIHYPTAPIIWGDIGTNGQHAFHQWLHQGTDTVPVDFIVCTKAHHELAHHQQWLYANCLAQSQALMQGRNNEEAYAECLQQGMSADEARRIAPHKVIPGNKPSNTFVLEQLTPECLGNLLALYEHKIFVQGVIWQINSFDQYGVELGKTIANQVNNGLNGTLATESFDSSTEQLIKIFSKK